MLHTVSPRSFKFGLNFPDVPVVRGQFTFT